MDGPTGRRSGLKKLAVLCALMLGAQMIWFLMGGWTRVPVEQVVIAAPVNPLYQPACPAGDAGVPAWVCTTMVQLANNDNALRSGVNAVTAAQAPTLAPKTGYTSTGAIKFDATGVVMAPVTTAGITAEAVKVLMQTADAGIVKHGLSGNRMELTSTLASTMYAVGSIDAGQVFQVTLNDYALKPSPVGRIVDAGVDVGVGSIFAERTTISPATNFDRLAGGADALCTVGGTFGASEILRCAQRTTFSDTTTRETDAGVGDWTFSATGTNVQKAYTVFRKEGTYVTGLDLRCHIDAGTTDVNITCETHAEQQ